MTIIKTYFSETVFYSGLGAESQPFGEGRDVVEKGSFFQNNRLEVTPISPVQIL